MRFGESLCLFVFLVRMENTSRFTWAVAEMSFAPGDEVLEIGPGAGIALEMIASQVPSGRVVALDQSQPMLAKAESRIKKAGFEDRVTFMKAKAETADLAGFRFDKVFAFNVNIFLKDTDLTCVLHPIIPGGIIGVFYENPPGSDKRRLMSMLEKIQTSLSNHRLEIINNLVYPGSKTTPTGGVVARKN